MESGYILDTNIVIYYLDGTLGPSGKVLVENAINGGAKISVISKIELLCWNPPRESRLERIRSFVNDSIVLGLDDTVAERTIELRKGYRRIKLPDAIIAATALCFNFNLITRNVSDFSSIDGLKSINPFTL